MPLPLLGIAVWSLVRTIAAWMMRHKIATAYLASTVYDASVDQEIGTLWHDILQVLGRLVSYAMGIELDDDDPFSTASISTAMTRKTGIPIRDFLDRDMLREDLESYALERLHEVTGYRLSSVSDPERVRADLEQIAAQVLAERTGVPLRVTAGADAIREDMIAWCAPMIYERILDAAQTSDRPQLLAEMRKWSGAEVLGPRQLAARLNAATLAQAMQAAAVIQRTDVSKTTRRKLQLRAAQKKFRSRHGIRQEYIPLGFTSSVERET